MAKWRASQVILVALPLALIGFLAWSAWQSSAIDAQRTAEVNQSFRDVPCVLTSAGWRELTAQQKIPSVQPGQPQFRTVVTGFEPRVAFRYQVGQTTYTSERYAPRLQPFSGDELARFKETYRENGNYTCRYDPNHPEVAYLTR